MTIFTNSSSILSSHICLTSTTSQLALIPPLLEAILACAQGQIPIISATSFAKLPPQLTVAVPTVHLVKMDLVEVRNHYIAVKGICTDLNTPWSNSSVGSFVNSIVPDLDNTIGVSKGLIVPNITDLPIVKYRFCQNEHANIIMVVED